MRSFEYRTPRFAAAFHVDLLLPDRTVHGQCSDIHEDGMRVTLEDQVTTGDTGSLVLRHPRCQVSLQVAVCRVEYDHVALRFLTATTEDAAHVQQAIARIRQLRS